MIIKCFSHHICVAGDGCVARNLSLLSDCSETAPQLREINKLLCQLLWILEGVGTERLIYSLIQSIPRSLEVTACSTWNFELQAIMGKSLRWRLSYSAQPAHCLLICEPVHIHPVTEGFCIQVQNWVLLSLYVFLIHPSKTRKITVAHMTTGMSMHMSMYIKHLTDTADMNTFVKNMGI